MPIESLPDHYEWFSDQIAGHHPSVIKNGRREIGLLKFPGSKEILKPKQDAERGDREVALYQLLAGPSCRLRNSTRSATKSSLEEVDDMAVGESASNASIASSSVGEEESVSAYFEEVRADDVETLRELTVNFYGLQILPIDGETHEFMILEDVTASYRLPAILDVKMGLVTYDPNASESKKTKETVKYPPQAFLGCRLLGYRIHAAPGQVVVRDKDWGKSFDEKTFPNGLREFFSGRSGAPDQNQAMREVVHEAITALEPIRQFFKDQRSFQFFASSLLFVYEADITKPIRMRIVMIDFSHAFSSSGKPDENYLAGLEKLNQELENFLV
ncbi:unnamed protein product [Caenorhabditis auriculariae]|uniref:Kinase n=1 Tax=Caenorhabditis auriculariae TaxID=2777116 RepID=A0A8S1HB79_9PELO|nr:unnamed protein product [Caenorhabditis auriculariae]